MSQPSKNDTPAPSRKSARVEQKQKQPPSGRHLPSKSSAPLAVQTGQVALRQTRIQTQIAAHAETINTRGLTRVWVNADGTVNYQGEDFSLDAIMQRLENSSVNLSTRAGWIHGLITQLRDTADVQAIFAADMDERIRATDSWQYNKSFQLALADAMGVIRPLAEVGRSAKERRDASIPKIQEFFGTDFYQWYFAPYMTTSLADALIAAIKNAFKFNLEPFDLTKMIMSAWGKRLQLAATGAGQGGNLNAKMSRGDVVNAHDGFIPRKSELTKSRRLANNALPDRAIVDSYNRNVANPPPNKKDRRKPQPRVSLDKHRFLHAQAVPDTRLIGPNPPVTTPTLKFLRNRVTVLSDVALLPGNPGMSKEDVKKDAEMRLANNSGTKPSPAGSSRQPDITSRGLTAIYTAAEEPNWLQSKDRKAKRKALSTIASTQGNSLDDAIDLSEYSFQADDMPIATGLQYSGFTKPSSDSNISQRIERMTKDFNKLKGLGDVKGPDDPNATGTLQPIRGVELGRQYQQFVTPTDATDCEKAVAFWLGQIARSIHEPDFVVGRFKDLASLKGFSDAERERAVTKIARLTYSINNKSVRGTSQWPREMVEAHNGVIRMFEGMQLHLTGDYPRWIQQINFELASIYAVVAPTHDRLTRIPVGHDADGPITFSAAEFTEKVFFYKGGSEQYDGWLHLDFVIACVRLFLSEMRGRNDPWKRQVIDDDVITVFLSELARAQANPDIEQQFACPSWGDDAEELYIPMFVNKNHFLLAVVDLNLHTIHFMNSMTGCGTMEGSNRIRRWLQAALPTATFTEQHENAVQQSNMADCGFWVIENARYFARNGLASPRLQDDTATLRANLASQLSAAFHVGWERWRDTIRTQRTALTPKKPKVSSSPASASDKQKSASPAPQSQFKQKSASPAAPTTSALNRPVDVPICIDGVWYQLEDGKTRKMMTRAAVKWFDDHPKCPRPMDI